MERHLATSEIAVLRTARRTALRSIAARRADAAQQEAWVRRLHGVLPEPWRHYLAVLRGHEVPRTAQAIELCDEIRSSRRVKA